MIFNINILLPMYVYCNLPAVFDVVEGVIDVVVGVVVDVFGVVVGAIVVVGVVVVPKRLRRYIESHFSF